MVANGGSGGGSRRFTSGLDDSSTSLLDSWDEGFSQPLSISDKSWNWGSSSSNNSFSVGDVWVLSLGVISPDNNILNISAWDTESSGDLVHRSVLVKSSQSSNVSSWDLWSEFSKDSSVSVSWVTDNADLNIWVGVILDESSLSLEDSSVGLQQVSSNHTLSSWSSTNQQSNLASSESISLVN